MHDRLHLNGSGFRVGYVVKRYPRFSETFIVNEILAHEASGLDLEIFSLRPCNDTHFQDRIAAVRAPLTQLVSARPKTSLFLDRLRDAARRFPHVWEVVAEAEHADAVTLVQGIALAELAHDGKISHLHAHFATLPASVAMIAAKLAGISFTFTAHAKDIFHESVNRRDFAAKLAAASSVVTVSEFNLEFLTHEYDPPIGHVRRVYNGMDLDALPYTSPERRAPTIVGVGRLVEKKGFDDLIRACSILDQQGVSFQCKIVGGGEDEPQLRSLIDQLHASHCVELRGPVPQGQLKGMIASSAAMAAPCVVGDDGNRDGLPTVLLESMALGTPCVATPVTGIPEVIADEETGLLVPERSPEQLASALARLLTDQSLRIKLARSARDLIESQFDARRTSQQLREIFDESVAAGVCAAVLEGGA